MYDLTLETELFYLVFGNVLHELDPSYGRPTPSERVQKTIQEMPLSVLEYENFRELLVKIQNKNPQSRSVITDAVLDKFDVLIAEAEVISETIQ